jgi:type III pantothenate kinase
MKTLVLDLGNSTLFAGLFDGGRLLRSTRIDAGRERRPPPANATGKKAAPDDPVLPEFRSGMAAALRRFARVRIDAAVLCSVVPARTALVARAVRRAFGVAPQMLTATADHGLKIAYRQPGRLGADRVAAALGAQRLYPRKNIIVVDCGTATTLTLLRRDGTLLGGSILPGLALWPAMLAQRTAGLPLIPLQTPRRAVARDTEGALRSGIVLGHAGAVRELVARSRAEAFGRAPAVVIGTGGMAPRLKGQRLFTSTEPALILHGLQSFLLR